MSSRLLVFYRKTQLMTFHHYLKHRFNIGNKHSDPSLFNSARSNWPCTDNWLKWEIKPTTIIDDDKGLCLLVCKDHSYKDLKSKFLHIPKNKHYDNTVKEEPEVFAPAAIKPNFIKRGSHGHYTTSGPKVKVAGGYQGMFSFSIYPTPDQSVRMNEETTSCQIAALKRQEIRIVAVKMHGKEEMKDLMRNDHFRSIYYSNTQNHGGTFIDLNDVLFNWYLLQKEIK